MALIGFGKVVILTCFSLHLKELFLFKLLLVHSVEKYGNQT